MLGFHVYGIRCYAVNFAGFLLIPQFFKKARTKSTTSAFANCITKIVKTQLRLTLTILHGDQTDNNYDEIRAETS